MGTNKKSDKINGDWVNDLHSVIGQYIELETRDGILREGRFSGVKTMDMELDGSTCQIIHSVELNGDPMDVIRLERILSIKVIGTPRY